MSKGKTRLLVPVSLLLGLVLLVLAGCSSGYIPEGKAPASSPAGLSGSAVQSNSEGSVTIEARLLGHQNGSLVFEIKMDTHSVDLDSYDLKKLAVLRDSKGEYIPTDWNSAPGGHHRSGKLVFNHADSSAKTLELVIRSVVSVKERVLRWQA